MSAIVRLVAIVALVFVLLPLGTVGAAHLFFPSSGLGGKLVRARVEILMTAAALGGTVLLAGTVSTGYAVVVGFTCFVVVLASLMTDVLKAARLASEEPSGPSAVVPRPRHNS